LEECEPTPVPRSVSVALSERIRSHDDLPLSKILEGHYPGTFVSMALFVQ